MNLPLKWHHKQQSRSTGIIKIRDQVQQYNIVPCVFQWKNFERITKSGRYLMKFKVYEIWCLIKHVTLDWKVKKNLYLHGYVHNMASGKIPVSRFFSKNTNNLIDIHCRYVHRDGSISETDRCHSGNKQASSKCCQNLQQSTNDKTEAVTYSQSI